MSLRMKKILKISIIIAILIALGGCAFGAYIGGRVWTNKLPLTEEYAAVYSMGNYTLEADENGLFRVLKINDTHFMNGVQESDLKTLDGLRRVLEGTPVDLIIMDGDLVEGFNLDSSYDKENAIREFAELIEGYCIPWTFIPGNNDGEVDGSDRDVIAYMLRYEHFMAGNTEGLYGDMQFYIDIKHKGALVHTVALMDTGMRSPAVSGRYDHIRENQTEHLLGAIRLRGAPTSLFFHMQTPAFEEAYAYGVQYENMPKRYSQAYDTIPKNAKFDKMIENEGLITLISAGHQHGNDLCSYYNGRYYQLSSPSGYTAWMPEDVSPSVTLTVIDTLEERAEAMYHFEKLEV